MNANFGKKLGKGVVVSIIMVFLISSFAAASPWGDRGRGDGYGKGKGHGFPCGIWRNPKMVEELGLTDEQVAKLKDSDFALREKKIELKSRVDALHLQMEKAFSEDVVDEAAVRQLAEKITDLRGKLFTQGVESRLEVRKLLSADQLTKLKTLEFQSKQRHGKKRGKGKRHCPMYENSDMD